MGLDTTGSACTVALVNESQILAHSSEQIIRGHAERLAPMIADCLKDAALKPQHIDKISVCTGPGSFTGLRVALACAKGFALPRSLPVIGLSALQVWAAHADPEAACDVISVADVRRGELCWALFSKGQCVHGPVTQTADQARAEIATLNADKIVEDGDISGPVLAWLAHDLNPEHAPAAPLYSRPPDAKTPKPKTPKAQYVANSLKPSRSKPTL